jgi:hypothetical protein
MSALGRSCRFDDVRAMSALLPIATQNGHCRRSAQCHQRKLCHGQILYSANLVRAVSLVLKKLLRLSAADEWRVGRIVMIRIFGIAIGIAIMAVATLGTSFIDAVVAPSDAVAKENAPLKALVDLIVRKGLKGLPLGEICDRFRLRGPSAPDECRAFGGVVDDDDDMKKYNYQKGWYPIIYVYFESGSAELRVILLTAGNRDHRKSDYVSANIGYAFLTGVNGKLQMVASGKNVTGEWQWSAIAISADLRTIFAREVSFWVNYQKDLEALPDRKD